MKRWKITGPKQEIVTCENCEEGREFVCTHPENTQKLIRIRSGDSLFTSNKYLTGTASCYTFIRYLDPDPEPQIHRAKFCEIEDCDVFRYRNDAVIYWKCGLSVWGCDPETGKRSTVDGALCGSHELVILTGQTAELVEEE